MTHSFIALFTLLAFLGGSTPLPKPFQVAQDYGSGIPMLSAGPVVAPPSGVFKSVWLGHTVARIEETADLVEYFAAMGPAPGGITTNIDAHTGIISLDGTMTDLLVDLENDPEGSAEIEFTVMINGSPSLLTCTAAGTDFDCNGTVDVDVFAGDIITMRATNNSTAPAAGIQVGTSIAFETTTTNGSVLFGHTAPQTNDDQHHQFVGHDGAELPAAWLENAMVAPAGGTFKNMYIELQTALSVGGTSIVYTLQENGSDTSVTCTITEGASDGDDIRCNSGATSEAVEVGKRYGIDAIRTGVPNLPNLASGVTFISTVADEFIIAGVSDNTTHVSATETNTITTGDGTWATGTNNRETETHAFTGKALYVEMVDDPGDVNEEFVWTVMNASTGTALTCAVTFSCGDAGPCPCNITGESEDWLFEDDISIELNPNNNPATMNGVAWSIAAEVP